MKRISALIAITLLSAASAWAQHSSKEVQEDIERHKQMAAAHSAAAQCLQAGRNPDDCAKALQAACKGLALGKFCGMRHAH
jgi:thioredoxin-like negative regulator of GroEL